MALHQLKCWPRFFQPLQAGRKNFEVRFNDRNFAVDDVLHLQEYNQEKGFTGEALFRVITYVLPLRDVLILNDPGDHVVLGLRELKSEDTITSPDQYNDLVVRDLLAQVVDLRHKLDLADAGFEAEEATANELQAENDALEGKLATLRLQNDNLEHCLADVEKVNLHLRDQVEALKLQVRVARQAASGKHELQQRLMQWATAQHNHAPMTCPICSALCRAIEVEVRP
jgi:hypothetical protein